MPEAKRWWRHSERVTKPIAPNQPPEYMGGRIEQIVPEGVIAEAWPHGSASSYVVFVPLKAFRKRNRIAVGKHFNLRREWRDDQVFIRASWGSKRSREKLRRKILATQAEISKLEERGYELMLEQEENAWLVPPTSREDGDPPAAHVRHALEFPIIAETPHFACSSPSPWKLDLTLIEEGIAEATEHGFVRARVGPVEKPVEVWRTNREPLRIPIAAFLDNADLSRDEILQLIRPSRLFTLTRRWSTNEQRSGSICHAVAEWKS